MFNLDQSIAEWRRQVIAAGIKTPAPMEELESHLRDDIEQQMQAGLSQQQAFAIAVQRIGQIDALKVEFAKFNQRKTMYNHNRMYSTALAILVFYLAICTVGLINCQRMGLADAVLQGSYLQGWSLPWLTALHIFYTIAMSVTLWSRRYGRDSGQRATRLLNFALLPAIPVGTILAVYGLWKVDKEKQQFARTAE